MEFTEADSLPWERIVRFHLEIACRGEQSFFSLQGDADSERWTSLRGFSPNGLAGSWQLRHEQINSNSFRLAARQGSHQTVFIGGPCYLAMEFSNGQGFPRWRPLLYREVGLELSGESVVVTPRQAYWQLNPLIYAAMDRLSVRADGYEEIANQLVESATRIIDTQSVDAGSALRAALLRIVPELEAEIAKPLDPGHFREPPTEWVLFAPTNNFSPLTRNLIRDYRSLEARLTSNPRDIGGLALLEPRNAPAGEEEVDVRHIVPLNASQRAAVEAALGPQPLCVISGPPGCGKSQVVVSLLLNCWAAGRTVLFASNNNKAVDVVRDRLRSFEDSSDIAVRAGNQQQNNIRPALRRILQTAQGARQEPHPVDPVALETRRKALVAERAELNQFLDTKIPVRVEEMFGAALVSYADHIDILQSIEVDRGLLLGERAPLGLELLDPEEIRKALVDTVAWLKSLEESIEEDRENDCRRAQLGEEIAELRAQCLKLLRDFGVELAVEDEFDWLVHGPHPTSVTEWETSTRVLLEEVTEEDLADVEWNREFDRWSDEADAVHWADDALRFSEHLRAELAALLKTIDELDSVGRDLDAAIKAAGAIGIPEDAVVDMVAATQWLEGWAEYGGFARRAWDFLPGSKRRTVLDGLRTAERKLRGSIPVDVWIMIGVLDDDGRRRLAPFVSAAARLGLAKVRWAELEDTRCDVERRIGKCRRDADNLGLDSVPDNWNVDEWRQLRKQVARLIKIAGQAAVAWRRRAIRTRRLEELRRCGSQWMKVAAGSPVKEAWCKGAGEPFHRAFIRLAETQTVTTLGAARSLFHVTSLSSLTSPWCEAIKIAAEMASLRAELEALPKRLELVRRWVRERPASAVLPAWLGREWPDSGTRDAWSERLETINGWLSRWDQFICITLSAKTAKAESARQRGRDDLVAASQLLPEGESGRKLRGHVEVVITTGEAWPIPELTDGFHEFRPPAVRARLAGMDAEIQKISFEAGLRDWQIRLVRDTEALQAVHQLEVCYGRQYGRIEPPQARLFRDVLRLAPIWVTTAQASQAIPLEPDLFDIVVIDEASQCTVTNLLPLVYRGRKLVVIGDENQLPAIPTVQTSEESLLGRKHDVSEHLEAIGHSTVNVFSAAIEALPRRRAQVNTLLEHFRSHPQIIGFSNREIYRGALTLRKELGPNPSDGIDPGVHRIAVRGQATRGRHGGSWLNVEEGRKVVATVMKIKETAPHLSIGVVTPFTAQKNWLRAELEEHGLSASVPVDTAYGFQGDERDVMIFSAVAARGMTPASVRWVEDPPNMINVAVTRAREALFVIADFDFCMQQTGILKKLATYCRDVQLLRDTSPAELALYSRLLVEGLFPDIHPSVGGHEVDFTLGGAGGIRVAIEVDGQAHHEGRQAVDAGIDATLAGHGYRVMRIPAKDVFQTPVEVVHRIKRALAIS